MPSLLIFHLGTNYCPGDEEILEIQTLVAHTALHVSTMKSLRLSAYADAHRALISPARRLMYSSHRNCVMSAVEAPILLGRICSSWRAISHATRAFGPGFTFISLLPLRLGS
ncbi:hypothetical protein B0H17DRAFT_1074531 [Mycena rosella]|uniref:Uncharacterized protein n=1 Tax=Mycena rosella TaxID=1033263 RepID=A0AAD7D7W8_MYCRO|nr:hypothetical protein B0H17DRAFT_1074531 [Mycena rosella]